MSGTGSDTLMVGDRVLIRFINRVQWFGWGNETKHYRCAIALHLPVPSSHCFDQSRREGLGGQDEGQAG